MTRLELDRILYSVAFHAEKFAVMEKGDGWLIQLQYWEKDVDNPSGPPMLQKARKWYVSSHATESEVVRTCFLACMVSAEHRVREHFLYKGRRVFGPHTGIEKFLEIAKEDEERREPPK